MPFLSELIFGKRFLRRDQTDEQGTVTAADEVLVFNRNRRETKSVLATSFLSKLMARGASDSWILGKDHQIYIAGDELNPSEGWRDLTADLSAGKVAGSNVPTWAVYRASGSSPVGSGIYAYSFAAASMNEVWITFHVDHDYANGTAIYPHVHFSPTTTSTGTVVWGFEYSIALGHDQEAFPATSTIYKHYNIASNKQYQHLIAEVSDDDAPLKANLEPDSLILMRVFRDGGAAADDFPDAVTAFTVDIHYKATRFATKNKAPDFDA